jgi:hypothetical protein
MRTHIAVSGHIYIAVGGHIHSHHHQKIYTCAILFF